MGFLVRKSLIYLISSFLVLKVYPHGQMSIPRQRGCAQTFFPGTMQEYCSLWGNFGPNSIVGTASGAPVVLGDSVVCRDQPREAPYVEVEAGKTLELTYFLQAPHPGDCALYVSYDDDSIPDGQKQFALIWTMKDCLCYKENGYCSWFPAANQGTCPSGCPQKRTITATIPEWLPAGVAVFHHNWFASHPRESGAVAGYKTVELYSGCFDATIKNSNKAYTKSGITGMVKIPEVLPKVPLDFRPNFEPAKPVTNFGEMASYQIETQSPTMTKVTSSPTPKDVTISEISETSSSVTSAQIPTLNPDSGSVQTLKPYISIIFMFIFQIWSLKL